METLLTKIVERFLDSSVESVALRAILADKVLHAYKAPVETPFPHMTFRHLDSSDIYTMEPIIPIEESKVQFSVWDNGTSPLLVTRVMDLVKVVYDLYCVNVVGYGILEFHRRFQTVFEDSEKGWQGVLRYDVRKT